MFYINLKLLIKIVIVFLKKCFYLKIGSDGFQRKPTFIKGKVDSAWSTGSIFPYCNLQIIKNRRGKHICNSILSALK